MNQKLFVIGILFLAISGAGCVQAGATPSLEYSQSDLKHMQQSAHTPEQYTALASLYGEQQQAYLQKAADEKQEWLRRSQFTTSLYAKYPKPADTAHSLYDYYVYKATQAGSLSAKYSQLSTLDAVPKAH